MNFLSKNNLSSTTDTITLFMCLDDIFKLSNIFTVSTRMKITFKLLQAFIVSISITSFKITEIKRINIIPNNNNNINIIIIKNLI